MSDSHSAHSAAPRSLSPTPCMRHEPPRLPPNHLWGGGKSSALTTVQSDCSVMRLVGRQIHTAAQLCVVQAVLSGRLVLVICACEGHLTTMHQAGVPRQEGDYARQMSSIKAKEIRPRAVMTRSSSGRGSTRLQMPATLQTRASACLAEAGCGSHFTPRLST